MKKTTHILLSFFRPSHTTKCKTKLNLEGKNDVVEYFLVLPPVSEKFN